MGRSRFLVILAGLALACLCLPGTSLAGTFSWDLPANFTSTSPGANPDRDSYGAKPWSYVDAPISLLGSLNFQPLSTFRAATRGGLAGWSQDPSASDELIAVNPTNTTLSDGTDNFPTGQLVMSPAAGRAVAIAWTSPLSHAAIVSVTGTVGSADPNSCTTGFSWSLDDQNGVALQSGTGAGPGMINRSPAVDGGGTLYLTIRPPALLHNLPCDTALVSLHITTTESAGPHVTLATPANGALISGGQPRFAGSASTSFGASPTVTVRIYSGSTAGGTPSQTVTTKRSSAGGYSVGPNARLADGLYTAQAEQDDLASPADPGLSATTTFRVHNAAPRITLKSLGSKPLLTATPTLTGVAGTASGDTRSVVVLVYPGATTNAAPVRYLTGSVGGGGAYSVKVTPELADGQYTAVAGQSGGQAAGLSQPMTFRIKVHAPAVTVTSPAKGSSATQSTLSFSGSAGHALGDSSLITLLVYAGSRAHGKAVGTVRTRANGGVWNARLTFTPKQGVYTAVAKQSDDAGNTGVSSSVTFLVVSGPTVVGSAVKLSSSGVASVPITCLASAGKVCTGNVLVLTAQKLQPVPGGPVGPVRVLFAYVSIPAGKTEVVSRTMRADVARALRKRKSVQVRVLANLTGAAHSTVVRTLHFAR